QNIVPYQVFAASDGHLIVAVGNDSQYRAYCRAIGHPELAEDPRYLTNHLRVSRREELVAKLSAIMLEGTRDDWLTKLEAVGVPCGPINNVEQTFADQQGQARERWRTLPHALGGSAPTTASPIRLSETPVEYRYAPPMLGEHTQSVLSEHLGWTDEQISALSAKPDEG